MLTFVDHQRPFEVSGRHCTYQHCTAANISPAPVPFPAWHEIISASLNCSNSQCKPANQEPQGSICQMSSELVSAHACCSFVVFLHL